MLPQCACNQLPQPLVATSARNTGSRASVACQGSSPLTRNWDGAQAGLFFTLPRMHRPPHAPHGALRLPTCHHSLASARIPQFRPLTRKEMSPRTSCCVRSCVNDMDCVLVTVYDVMVRCAAPAQLTLKKILAVARFTLTVTLFPKSCCVALQMEAIQRPQWRAGHVEIILQCPHSQRRCAKPTTTAGALAPDRATALRPRGRERRRSRPAGPAAWACYPVLLLARTSCLSDCSVAWPSADDNRRGGAVGERECELLDNPAANATTHSTTHRGAWAAQPGSPR
jgi:hypothetical protein